MLRIYTASRTRPDNRGPNILTKLKRDHPAPTDSVGAQPHPLTDKAVELVGARRCRQRRIVDSQGGTGPAPSRASTAGGCVVGTFADRGERACTSDGGGQCDRQHGGQLRRLPLAARGPGTPPISISSPSGRREYRPTRRAVGRCRRRRTRWAMMTRRARQFLWQM